MSKKITLNKGNQNIQKITGRAPKVSIDPLFVNPERYEPDIICLVINRLK